MLSIAFSEMMIHLPLCTHKEATKVLLIGKEDENIKKQIIKHKKESSFEFIEARDLLTKDKKGFDIIIFLNQKPTRIELVNSNQILKNDGILCFPSTSLEENEESLKEDLKETGEYFWIAMPFKFENNTAILASKKYHPTADINLQRANLLDNLDYFSAEIQLSSFVFPAGQHKALTGFAKR